jgi:hypothetical protein
VGCCGSSPVKHARKHRERTHPLIRSIEPKELGAWCYPDNTYLTRVRSYPREGDNGLRGGPRKNRFRDSCMPKPRCCSGPVLQCLKAGFEDARSSRSTARGPEPSRLSRRSNRQNQTLDQRWPPRPRRRAQSQNALAGLGLEEWARPQGIERQTWLSMLWIGWSSPVTPAILGNSRARSSIG